MRQLTRFVGLDVHAETIAVAVAEPDGDVRDLGIIPNRAEMVRKLVRKLGPTETLKVCYEAGPCGYALYWQLVELGVAARQRIHGPCQLLDQPEQALSLRPLGFLGREQLGVRRGVVHHLREDHRPRRRQRTPGPPQV